MLLAKLQGTLQSHYDLDVPYGIEQFFCSDKDVAQRLAHEQDGVCAARSDIGEEHVFIHQENDTLEFTVYIDEALLSSLDNSAVCELDELCTVVEGASHAICLLWHAHNDRQVRPVDLELQAEIDKYVVLGCHMGNRVERRELHRKLFDSSRYIDKPGTALFERYYTASTFAARYCQWLDHQFPNGGSKTPLLQELARFYRLSGRAKFERIKQLH
jgi:hypothetical protein